MLYLTKQRFADKCAGLNDTQFVNYVEACIRSKRLSTEDKINWLRHAIGSENAREDTRTYRIESLAVKIQRLEEN